MPLQGTIQTINPTGIIGGAGGGPSADAYLMEDGASYWLMEDGASHWLL